MDLKDKAKNFIKGQHYNGEITEKGSTAEQNFTRLIKAISIFEEHGIIFPSEADFDNILRPEVASKGKRTGELANEKTIRRTLNLTRKFYNSIKEKGDFQMTDNDIMTTAGEFGFSPETSSIEDNQAEINNGKREQEAEAKKTIGRPKTGRTEKFTLYVSAEALEDLTMLTEAYNTNLTELLNKLIDDYRSSQFEQIAWLKKQKQQFTKLFVNQEARND